MSTLSERNKCDFSSPVSAVANHIRHEGTTPLSWIIAFLETIDAKFPGLSFYDFLQRRAPMRSHRTTTVGVGIVSARKQAAEFILREALAAIGCDDGILRLDCSCGERSEILLAPKICVD